MFDDDYNYDDFAYRGWSDPVTSVAAEFFGQRARGRQHFAAKVGTTDSGREAFRGEYTEVHKELRHMEQAHKLSLKYDSTVAKK